MRGQIDFANFNPNFLLGVVSNSTIGTGIWDRKLRTTDYNFFLQHDWVLSSNATLNLGLRYELDLPPYDSRGRLATFDPARYRPRPVTGANGVPIGPPVDGFVQAFMAFLWDVPALHRPYRSTVARSLLSNWQLSGIVVAMSGLPIDVVDTGAGSFYGLSGGSNALARAQWAPGATRGTASGNVPAGYFFNPAAFVRPIVQTGQLIPSSNGAATADANGTDIGNVGRNVLRGPRQSNIDFSVIKRFSLGELRNLEFRTEFFNLFNHVNFANPISDLNSVPSGGIDPQTGKILSAGTFGRIISTSNNPRIIQFALKFNY